MILTADLALAMMTSERGWRVVNSIGSGAAFLAIGGVALAVHRAQGTGHRALTGIAAAAFLVRSAANFLGAWQVYKSGALSWDVWLFFTCMITSCVLAAALIAAFDDVLTTLRTSEYHQVLRNEKDLDLQSMRNLLEHISCVLMTRSAAPAQVLGTGSALSDSAPPDLALHQD